MFGGPLDGGVLDIGEVTDTYVHLVRVEERGRHGDLTGRVTEVAYMYKFVGFDEDICHYVWAGQQIVNDV